MNSSLSSSRSDTLRSGQSPHTRKRGSPSRTAGRGKTGPHRPLSKPKHVTIGSVTHSGAKELVLPIRVQRRKNYRGNITGLFPLWLAIMRFGLRCDNALTSDVM